MESLLTRFRGSTEKLHSLFYMKLGCWDVFFVTGNAKVSKTMNKGRSVAFF